MPDAESNFRKSCDLLAGARGKLTGCGLVEDLFGLFNDHLGKGADTRPRIDVEYKLHGGTKEGQYGKIKDRGKGAARFWVYGTEPERADQPDLQPVQALTGNQIGNYCG